MLHNLTSYHHIISTIGHDAVWYSMVSHPIPYQRHHLTKWTEVLSQYLLKPRDSDLYFSNRSKIWQAPALLLRCLSNSRATPSLSHPISRLRDFTRFGGKTSCCSVNRGPDYLWHVYIDYLERHEPLTRYVKLWIAHAPGMWGTFSPTARVIDPDLHHGTCVTHVPWCMSGSITSGFRLSWWRGKRSRHSRRMRNPQFYLSDKTPMEFQPVHVTSSCVVMAVVYQMSINVMVPRIAQTTVMNSSILDVVRYVNPIIHNMTYLVRYPCLRIWFAACRYLPSNQLLYIYTFTHTQIYIYICIYIYIYSHIFRTLL